MTYRGHVENGTVVLDEPGHLPEGAQVEVALVEPIDAAVGDGPVPTLCQGIESARVPTQAAPFPGDFWASPTVDQLAESQGVRPIEGVHLLFGTWPGEDDDGFEDEIRSLRKTSPARGPGP